MQSHPKGIMHSQPKGMHHHAGGSLTSRTHLVESVKVKS